MEEVLIKYETAKLANKKGFKEFYQAQYYYKDGTDWHGLIDSFPYGKPVNDDEIFTKCPQSLLQKWLRETHQLHLEIQVQDYVETPKFYWNIFGTYKNNNMIRCIANSPREDYTSYEEALEAGLQKALSYV